MDKKTNNKKKEKSGPTQGQQPQQQRVNFSPEEIDVLEESIITYGQHIFGSKPLMRKLGYEAMTKRINRVSITHRSVKSVKNRVRGDLANAKTKKAFATLSLLKTGGGPPEDATPLSAYEELLLSFVKDEVIHGIKGGTDTSKRENCVKKFRPPLKRKENVLSSSSDEEEEGRQCSPPKKKAHISNHKSNCSSHELYDSEETFYCKVRPSTSKATTMKNILFGKPLEAETVNTSESSDEDTVDVVASQPYDNKLQVCLDENEDLTCSEVNKCVTVTLNDDKECQTVISSKELEEIYQQNHKIEKEDQFVNALEKQTSAINSLTAVIQKFIESQSPTNLSGPNEGQST